MAEVQNETAAAIAKLLEGKSLEEMKHPEVLELAELLQITGRHSMKKVALLEAVQAGLASLANPSSAPASDTEPPSSEATPTDPPPAGDEGGERITQPPNPDEEETAEAAQARALAERKRLEGELVLAAEENQRQEAERQREEEEAERQRTAAASRKRGAKDAEERARAEARAAAHARGELTDEDWSDIRSASTNDLAQLLVDGDAPSFVLTAVREEHDKRKRREQLEIQRKAFMSPVEQYRITGGPNGMRFVVDGYVTTLPLGSIVGPLTHNMSEVRSQGFTWELLAEVVHSIDQMGVTSSTTRGKEA
jgi:type IV secretory pathway VirB10-like protein